MIRAGAPPAGRRVGAELAGPGGGASVPHRLDPNPPGPCGHGGTRTGYGAQTTSVCPARLAGPTGAEPTRVPGLMPGGTPEPTGRPQMRTDEEAGDGGHQ